MSKVLAGMEKVANEADYNLLISQSLETVSKEIANAKTMFDSRVDGLLVSLSYDTQNLSHFNAFTRRKIPLVFFDRVADHPKTTSVIIDNFKAGYEITRHLLEQGCRDILHITGNLLRNVYKDRMNGYKQALSEFDIPIREDRIITTDMSEEAGVEMGQKILGMKARPDGVFVANDTCAVSCMITLKQEGIEIPHDIAFAGFNNAPISRVVEPALTTVNYPAREMGEVAMTNLINHLNGTSSMNATNTIILRSELIIRGSSIHKENVES